MVWFLICCLIVYLIDWLIDWLIVRLIDWWIDWLIDWLTDRLTDWLIDRLKLASLPVLRGSKNWWIDCLIDWLDGSKMVPRWLQDGQLDCRGVGATGPGAILGPSWISVIFSKKVAKIIDFYSIFETDPAFRLDENAARALKCVRGRKNERRYRAFPCPLL